MKYLKNIKLSKQKQTIIILISIFIMMLVLNLLTPLLADDYSYSLSLDDTKINSLMDVINYQWWHYFNWGGRTVAHTIAQLFLLFPKIVFSIINPMIYVALVYLIYLHTRLNREDKPLFLLLIHFALWFCLPVFGQTCLWLIGSCNYLWTTVLILWFLWIYRNHNNKDSILKIIGIFIFGIIAGWTNENTSFGLIVLTLGILLIDKYKDKKKKIPKYKWSGLLGSIVGFLILILAPGNYVRADVADDKSFILIKIIKRAINYTIIMTDYLLPLIIVTVIAFSIYIFYKKKIHYQVWLFLLAAFLSIYAMVLSPQFPERSWFGVIIFLLIANLTLLYEIDKFHKVYKVIIIDTIIILSFIYIGEYLTTTLDINNLRNAWEYRENYIKKQKKKGNTKIKLGPFYTENSKNPTYGLADIIEDKDEWPNNDLALYFNVKSIEAKTD